MTETNYKISELARLFSLCPDTLRYYEERGLLHPTRGENGYRQYGIQDICTLNIVRSLREIGMAVEEIRAYLQRRSLASTLALLDKEDALLRARAQEIKAMQRETARRRAHLLAFSDVQDGIVTFAELPERPFVSLREDVILEREIDFLLKKLEKRHQDYLKIIGDQCMGAALEAESLKKGVYNHFSTVFFLTEKGRPHDGVLPAGQYASLFYRGAYEGLKGHCQRLFAEVEAAGLVGVGAPFELYRLDAHDTNTEAEYLTELQLRVTPKGETA